MGGAPDARAGDRGPPKRPDRGGGLIPAGRLIYLLPAAAHAGLIFYLSSQPNLRLHVHVAGADKYAHGLFYAVLALLVAWGLGHVAPAWSRRRLLLVAFLLPLLYGVSDEFHQHFVPGRSVDALDVAADGAGALVVIALLAWSGWRRNRARARVPG